MNKEIDQKIQEIVKKIAENYRPEKIILFGSYAWGEPGPDSDVDLLIVKESDKRRIDRERELRTMLFGNKFPPMDLLIYTPSEVEKKIKEERNLFIEDIVQNGKILYDRV